MSINKLNYDDVQRVKQYAKKNEFDILNHNKLECITPLSIISREDKSKELNLPWFANKNLSINLDPLYKFTYTHFILPEGKIRTLYIRPLDGNMSLPTSSFIQFSCEYFGFINNAKDCIILPSLKNEGLVNIIEPLDGNWENQPSLKEMKHMIWINFTELENDEDCGICIICKTQEVMLNIKNNNQ